MATAGLLAQTEVWAPASADVTDSQFKQNRVTDLGNGANMNGAITNGGRKFDAGVEIGTQGRAADDIQSTSFVLRVPGTGLTLDEVAGQRFGVRYTSVGDIGGARSDSLKLSGIAPNAPNPPDAIDDVLVTDEDTPAGTNLLTNDTDADGDPLTVTGIAGGPIGTAFGVVSDGGRLAQVTVLADGSFTVDPDGNFEDLATGETDTFDLAYTISDGNGGTDSATVTVTVTGVNDGPVATDDAAFYVEYGGVALADVLANDTDVDGTINPASLAIAGADLGTATNQGGQVRYAANPIVYDTSDSSANDGLTYTVEDNEGALSNAAAVTAKVIDPLRETDTDAAAALNGQNLSISLSTEDRTFNTSSFVQVAIASGTVDQDVNISFVIDGSGSITTAEYTEQLKVVQNTINDLRAEYQNSVADVTVQLVQFSDGAQQATFDLYDHGLDSVVDAPLSPQLRQYTNYEAGLQLAVTFFNGQAADDNFLLFASDGEPNRPNTSIATFQDEVNQLQALNVSRTAVGFGNAVPAPLNAIDNTGGATIVTSAADLGDVFADSPLFSADLFDFTLTVNGVQVADESDLVSLGGGDYAFDPALDPRLFGLDNTLGATNEVVATARFDTDNDGIADTTRIAETVINGTDGSDILFA